jgi:MFS family permease
MNQLARLISAYRASFSGLPRDVWLLASALLVNRAGTMVLPFLSLYLTHDLGLTAARAGLIIGCFGLGSMVGSYLGGWLSDRVDPLKVQELSLFLSGVGFLAFILLESLTSLIVGVFSLAVISDAFRPALMAAVAQRSGTENRARAFALIRLAANFGMAVGPAVAGMLAVYGYVWIFVGDALTCWAAAIMLFITFTPGSVARTLEGDRDKNSDNSPWRDPPFLALMFLVILLAMTFFQVWSTVPLYLQTFFGMTEWEIGLLLALNAGIIVATEMLLVRAVEGRDRMRVVGLGALMVCAGLALLPFGPSSFVAVLAMIVLTFGEMLSMPFTNAVVAERAGSGSVGRYMGAFSLAFSTAFVLGPISGTFIYQNLGPETLWFGIGTLGIVLAFAFASLSRPLRKPH